MPESKYQIVQMNAPLPRASESDPIIEVLTFPKVPIEALIEDADHRLTPFGMPARAVLLNAYSPTAPAAPTAINQRYYNSTSRKIIPAKASGNAFVWDTDESHMEDPQDGMLYAVRQNGSIGDTLYVKSVGIGVTSLEALVIRPTVNMTYNGPFAVSYTTGADNVCTCAISAGAVFRGTHEKYDIPAATNLTVPSGASLYMRLNGPDNPDDPLGVAYTTDWDETSQFRVRIAVNQNGVMVQCQYGDVYSDNIPFNP